MPEAQVVAAPEAPPAPPAAATVPEAPAGETPAPQAGEAPAPTGETPPVKSEESEADRQRRHRRQLNTAYRKQAEAQARADLLQRQLDEARKPAATQDSGAPKLEQFDFDAEKYAAAREKYAAEKALKEVETKQRQESQRQFQQRIASTWAEKVAETEHDDFHEVVGDIAPNDPLSMAIMDAGPSVAYHLGKAPAEVARIRALPLLAQIREIGKLEAKLAATPPTPKTPSRAPAPITPVTGSAPAPTVKDLTDPNLPYEEFVKIRNKQLGRRTA